MFLGVTELENPSLPGLEIPSLPSLPVLENAPFRLLVLWCEN
jgi:hypothetical protein